MKIRKTGILLFFTLLIFNSFGQLRLIREEKPDPKFAKWCIEYENYYDGLNEYYRLLKEDSSVVLYHHMIGYSYLHSNHNKAEAIKWLEWTVKQPDYNPEAYYDLAEAYMVNNQLDKAIKTFEKYKSLIKEDAHKIPADRMIEMCKNAQLAIKNPVNVRFENIGKNINTENPEYSAFIPSNESMILFNSNRPENYGNYRDMDGNYPSDIYYSVYKFGKWKRNARFSSAINTENNEEIIGYAADGSLLFIYTRVVMGGEKKVLMSEKKGRYYQAPTEFLSPEFKFYNISAVSISTDKKVIVFAAKLQEKSNNDLYLSRKLPNNTWSNPEIVDSVINSEYDENYPYFGADGYFYFASKGFNSMGGYDIFKCKFDTKNIKFGKISNLGYPVNTCSDDKTISVSATGRYTYISTVRDSGEGDLDIYRVIFKDAQPTYTLLKGRILSADSLPFTVVVKEINKQIDSMNMPVYAEYKKLLQKKDTLKAEKIWSARKMHENIDIQILAYNNEDNKLFGKYIAKNSTANFALILPPGDWKIVFKRKGFEDEVIQHILIEERDNRNKEIVMNVVLQPKS